MVPHRDGGQSRVLLNDGGGGFEEEVPFGPPDAAIRSARAADLDGDGILDLAAIDQRTGPALFRGRGDGSFAPGEPLDPGDVASGARPYAIAVADVDRNGRTDVVVGFVEARPVVYFNDGPGPLVPVPFGEHYWQALIRTPFAFGDLDEDGFLDIAMARSDATNMVYFGGAAAGGS